MSSYDSKMARSLQAHNLENLVFEKRKRKNVQPTPSALAQKPVSNTLPTKFKSSKKIKKINKYSKNKNKVQKSPNTKQATSKASHIKKQTGKTKLALQKFNQQLNQKHINKHNLAISKSMQNKKIVQQFIQKRNKKGQTHQTLKRDNSPSGNLQNHLNQKQQIQLSCKKEKPSNSRLSKQLKQQDQIEIAKQSQNKKIINSKQKDRKLQIHQQHHLKRPNQKIIMESTPKKKSVGRPRKIVNQPISKSDEKISFNNMFKMQEQGQQSSEQKSCQVEGIKKQNDRLRVPMVRQAKLNAINYSERRNMQETIFSSEKKVMRSKKKKISKVLTQQRYSINRIFRKQQKIERKGLKIPVDLQAISLNSFSKKFGKFDIIHCSAPLSLIWGLNELESLMQKGFMFIWVQKGQTILGYHFMNRMGFDVVDQIIWIRSDEENQHIYNDYVSGVNQFSNNTTAVNKSHKLEKEQQNQQSYEKINDLPTIQKSTQSVLNQQNLFLNCKKVCLVGYKCPAGAKVEYRTKISNNVIFVKPDPNPVAKPDEIFEIADLLMPGSSKLQIGGPAQPGWLALEHHQQSLRHCFRCFQDKNLYLKTIEDKYNKNNLGDTSNFGKLRSICLSCCKMQNEAQKQMLKQVSQSDSQKQEAEQKKPFSHKIEYTFIGKQQSPQKKTQTQNLNNINAHQNQQLLNPLTVQYVESNIWLTIQCSKCGQKGQDEYLTQYFQSQAKSQQSLMIAQSVYFCKECWQKDHASQKQMKNNHNKNVLLDKNLTSLKTKPMNMIVIAEKQEYIEKAAINCTHCDKATLCDYYFECSSHACRGKNHIMCSDCFWEMGLGNKIEEGQGKSKGFYSFGDKDEKERINRAIRGFAKNGSIISKGSNENKNGNNEQKQAQFLGKKKYSSRSAISNKSQHELKLKRIVSVPGIKLFCSCNRQELTLPYYVCQSCMGWRWCGKCQIKLVPYHPHFQANQEGEALDSPQSSHILSLIT